MQVVPQFTGKVDVDLTQYQKEMRNAASPADLLFPRVEVQDQKDFYFIAGKEALQRTEQTLRAPGAPAQRTRFTMSTNTYVARSHALASDIPDESTLNYRRLGSLSDASVRLNQGKILNDRDAAAVALVSNPANYTSSHTLALSGSGQWDQPTADIIANIRLARKAIRRDAVVVPNSLLLSDDVADALRTAAQLVQRVQYNMVAGFLRDDDLAKLLNVSQVLVASTVTNDAITGNNTFNWSNFALLFYNNTPAGTPQIPFGGEGLLTEGDMSFGKTFTWVNAPQTVGGYGVVTGRHPDPTAKSAIVGVDWYYDMKITAAESAYLWTNVLANPG